MQAPNGSKKIREKVFKHLRNRFMEFLGNLASKAGFVERLPRFAL